MSLVDFHEGPVLSVIVSRRCGIIRCNKTEPIFIFMFDYESTTNMRSGLSSLRGYPDMGNLISTRGKGVHPHFWANVCVHWNICNHRSALYLSNFESVLHVQVIKFLRLQDAINHRNLSKKTLNELLESTIDRRANFSTLVEVYCGYCTLADALGGKFKFLRSALALWLTFTLE